jgi:hypothetical protein
MAMRLLPSASDAAAIQYWEFGEGYRVVHVTPPSVDV